MLGPADLEVMRQSLTAVPEEMGIVLVRSAYSPNVKERKDASCAIFDPSGRMVAQAEHIPVHLGSMPLAVEQLLASGDDVGPGDVWIVNDPYSGGSHLPDVTVISGIHADDGSHLGFAVNKAHHSDVGGAAPGSMPASATSLTEEGVVIPLQPLVKGGRVVEGTRQLLLSASRTPREREGDLGAQLAANSVGVKRLKEFVTRYGHDTWTMFSDQVIEYSRKRMESAISGLSPGRFQAEGTIEGPGTPPHGLPDLEVPDMDDLRLAVEVRVTSDAVEFDLAGTDGQVDAPFNAPYSVTLSAVYYALRAVTDPSIPPNHGCYLPVRVLCPRGSLLNPTPPHPVGAGNVETSQRLAEVCLAAFGQASRDGPVAMSQGTMNNLLIGARGERAFSFYETLGGGEGGSPWRGGMSGTHTHMTNTANTPVESLEAEYPLRVRKLALRRGTGGKGTHPGGDGTVKEVELLAEEAVMTLLANNRKSGPGGAAGGGEGGQGADLLVRDGVEHQLPSKCTLVVRRGDVLRIATPGGGGWGDGSRTRGKPPVD